MEMMQAIRKEAPQMGLSLEKIPIQERLGPHEVRIQVTGASICGTDMHIYHWDRWAQGRIRPPMTVGHEMCGTVIETGSLVQHVHVGDFVSAETHIPCGHCRLCKTGKMHVCANMKILGVDTEGVFAEYATIPEIVLWKNDTALPVHWASVQEPLGNAVYTVMAANVPGKSLLICGAGPIGVMSVQVARALGAGPIIVTEVNPFRMEMAKANGADYVIHPGETNAREAIMDITRGEGVEAALEMSGNEGALHLALDALIPSGVLSLLGIFPGAVTLQINEMVVLKNLTLFGIAGRKMFETWYVVQSLLNNRRVNLDSIITHVLPLAQWQKGFDLMERGECGKIVIKLQE
jgi:threonine 3-dehydrogenase